MKSVVALLFAGLCLLAATTCAASGLDVRQQAVSQDDGGELPVAVEAEAPTPPSKRNLRRKVVKSLPWLGGVAGLAALAAILAHTAFNKPSPVEDPSTVQNSRVEDPSLQTSRHSVHSNSDEN